MCGSELILQVTMKTRILVILAAVLSACSGEPDCVRDKQFDSKALQGETRYSELKNHITCYDENGKKL